MTTARMLELHSIGMGVLDELPCLGKAVKRHRNGLPQPRTPLDYLSRSSGCFVESARDYGCPLVRRCRVQGVGDGDGKPGKAPFAILHLSKQSATSCMFAFLA